jgi:hypothetical protein
MAEHVHHIAPEDQSADQHHRQRQFLILDENGETIAGAEVDKYTRPIPLYQVTDLWSEAPGKGHASAVMDEVEAFMLRTKKPGVLVDAIDDDSPAKGMYSRRGWQYVPEQHGLMVYNWPQDVSLSAMGGYALRYTPLDERENFASNYTLVDSEE